MAEIDLMDRYPRTQRSLQARSTNVTDDVRRISSQFGREYFDGDRLFGYGGYNYHPRFWQETVRRFRDYYQLSDDARILDVGCAKGFMLHDFRELMPAATVAGIDVSEYAIGNSLESVRPFLRVGNAKELPYESKSFDLVTAINVVHNLPLEDCRQAMREIQRVSRGNSFVVVDAYRTPKEKARLERWIVTCRTYMHTDEWKQLFREVGYTGDYWWFLMPD
jgi:ubiquinone/menaquinone biosynthesis C-methylase UbiE